MTLSTIRNHLQTAGPHVGDLVWWALTDARIRREDLEQVWSNAGLATSLLPELPTPEKALKTAIREAQIGHREHLLRLGKEDDRELVFAVVQEWRDDAGNLDYRQQARIVLQRKGSAALDSDDPGHELVQKVRETYQELLGTHTSDDIRRALVRTLSSCSAVTLRENGGVYWVPAPYANTLRRLQIAVSAIGQSRLDLVPIHATPEATEALGHAARSALEDDLTALRAEVESFLHAPPERLSTLTRRLSVFEDLRNKARLYQSVLQLQVSDIEATLTNLAQHVEGLLQAKAA